MVTKDLGMVTAYAYAVAGGYTGTEAEFTQLMADLAVVVDDFDNFSVNVTTLPAGSSATASYADGVLSLGIPKGDKGDKGDTGETGAPAGFGTVSATVDDTIGTPSVEVTASGADTAKNFAFAFHNLKGEKGDKGDTGDVTLSQLEDFTVVQTDENIEPYNFRATPKCGHIERLKKVVGASVAFNQLVNPSTATADVAGVTMTESDGVFTFTTSVANEGIYFTYKQITGHKYLYSADIKETTATDKIKVDSWGSDTHFAQATTSWQTVAFMVVPSATRDNHRIRIFDTRTADWDAVQVKNVMVIDLTLALGSTIADYVYSLEQATEGSGVAWLKQHFPKMFGQYNAYDAGSIRSVEGVSEHKVVGFNAFDEETELGGFAWATGQPISLTDRWRSKDFSKCLPNTNYYGNKACSIFYYDENKNFISYDGFPAQGRILTTPANCHYFKLTDSASPTYNHDICINLSDAAKNGTYEPYTANSYPLDSSLELRGIPKLDNGNLYADGDEYLPSGQVNRLWGERAYQSGDVTSDTMITDGTTTVYKLSTPTTETADPFTENQICEAGGTEEFVSTSIVPIGHETEYPLTLSDIRPTANGNYVLKCTVTNGKASYEWVSA